MNLAAPLPTHHTAGNANDSEVVEVVAQGMGVDQSSALENAYSNAVQQALGLYVDAETMVQNDQIVRDQILTYSKGFIQEIDLISESQANGLFQVNIHAKVRRQQLLEQAKASNISIKKVEGASLHAQVLSQIKQEEDAKALLDKVLMPLTKVNLYRAALANERPTIVKEQSDKDITTLNYKYYLWVDEKDYINYVKNDLIPVLNQIATGHQQELTIKFKKNNDLVNEDLKIQADMIYFLTWRDKAFNMSKWLKYNMPENYKDTQIIEFFKNRRIPIQPVAIEISLLDKDENLVALGSELDNNCPTCSIIRYIGGAIVISPFSDRSDSNFLIPNTKQRSLNVKVSNTDLPRVMSAKLEIKPAGGK
jgi:hypothetical protein